MLSRTDGALLVLWLPRSRSLFLGSEFILSSWILSLRQLFLDYISFGFMGLAEFGGLEGLDISNDVG